ncbi:MAG: hypothetical protein V5A62_12230 [Haloarculaceae archaeon]
MVAAPPTEALVVLEPLTGVDGRTALQGFASPATVTILAMYVLSAGVQSTGAIRRLGARVAAFTACSLHSRIGATWEPPTPRTARS